MSLKERSSKAGNIASDTSEDGLQSVLVQVGETTAWFRVASRSVSVLSVLLELALESPDPELPVETSSTLPSSLASLSDVGSSRRIDGKLISTFQSCEGKQASICSDSRIDDDAMHPFASKDCSHAKYGSKYSLLDK